MTDVCARARELCAGITPRPWQMGDFDQPDVVLTPHGCLWNPVTGAINKPADGRFVAAAPELVRELVAIVERVEELADDLESAGYWRDRDYGYRVRKALEGK